MHKLPSVRHRIRKIFFFHSGFCYANLIYKVQQASCTTTKKNFCRAAQTDPEFFLYFKLGTTFTTRKSLKQVGRSCKLETACRSFFSADERCLLDRQWCGRFCFYALKKEASLTAYSGAFAWHQERRVQSDTDIIGAPLK